MIHKSAVHTEGVGEKLSLVNGIIIFGFCSTLVLIPQAHWWFGFAALLSSLIACGVLVFAKEKPLSLSGGDLLIALMLVAFGGVWWLSVLIDGSLPLLARDGYRHLYLWPFVAASALLAMRIFTPSLHWLWLGVSCGAVGAGLIAIYERTIIGLDRADNGINAIPFGNLSLLLAALSLMACIYYVQQHQRSFYWLALFALIAAFLGFLASLLSGTRGGWIAIPFLFLLLLPATSNLVSTRMRYIGLIAVILAMAAIVAYPPTGVWPRIISVFNDANRYFINSDADNSLGVRFELWRAGLVMFIEHPLFGVGEGAIQEWLPSLVSEEVAYERGVVYPHLHSDSVDTLARRGLLGILSLLLLYIVFIWSFAKEALMFKHQLCVRLLAISGVMVIIAFLCFGLTQSMLRDLRGLSGFLGLCVALWACLPQQPIAKTRTGPPV